jgi:hypothetical protein
MLFVVLERYLNGNSTIAMLIVAALSYIFAYVRGSLSQ